MDDLKKLTDKLEYLFLKEVVMQLKNGTLTLGQGKWASTEFLKLEPFQSVEDAKTKIHRFVGTNEMLKVLVEYVDAFVYEQKVDKVIDKMKKYIGEKKIDEALQVAVKS